MKILIKLVKITIYKILDAHMNIKIEVEKIHYWLINFFYIYQKKKKKVLNRQ